MGKAMNWDFLLGILIGSVLSLHGMVLLISRRGFFKNKKAVDKWIRVEDRLPVLGKWVLCKCDIEHNDKEFHIGKCKIKGNVFEIGCNPQDCFGNRVVPVTHWMPLPEPPREDD